MPKKINVLTNTADSFQINVYVPAGAIYEDKKFSGGSHMLEHMLFKNRAKKQPDLTKTLTSIGAIYNAYTTQDITVFYIKTISAHYREACKVMAQMMSRPNFDSGTLYNERKVVIEELNRSGNSNIDYFNKSILGKNNVYYKSVIGKKSVLSRMSGKDLRDYYSQRYDKLVVVANCAPKIKKEVTRLLSRLFGNGTVDVVDPEMIHKGRILDPKLIVKNSYNTLFRSIMTFALKTRPTTKQHLLLDFLRYCLSGAGMYSILYNSLRHDKGLVYMVRSVYMYLQYIQVFSIMLDTSSQKTEYIVSVIIEILYKLSTRGFTERELRFFKKGYASYLLNQERCPGNQSSYYGFLIFSDLYLSINDALDIVKSIKNEEMIELCQWVFDIKTMGFYTTGAYTNVDRISHKVEDVLTTYEKRVHT